MKSIWVIQRDITPVQHTQRLRYVGLVACGAGAAFLSSVVLA
ncbi:MAG: hypothetical protein AAGI69_27020 [Cyanobacteria bacterium P01_H01_bin.21]